jgi:hypothetical protein
MASPLASARLQAPPYLNSPHRQQQQTQKQSCMVSSPRQQQERVTPSEQDVPQQAALQTEPSTAASAAASSPQLSRQASNMGSSTSATTEQQQQQGELPPEYWARMGHSKDYLERCSLHAPRHLPMLSCARAYSTELGDFPRMGTFISVIGYACVDHESPAQLLPSCSRGAAVQHVSSVPVGTA